MNLPISGDAFACVIDFFPSLVSILRRIKDKQIFFTYPGYINDRRPVRFETFGYGAAPVYTPASISLPPGDRFPVWGKDEVATGEEFEAIATGFICVEVECLRDIMLGRTCLNKDVVIGHDVGGSQHLFLVIYPVRDMVQPSSVAAEVTRVGDIMHQRRDAKPGSFFDPTNFGL